MCLCIHQIHGLPIFMQIPSPLIFNDFKRNSQSCAADEGFRSKANTFYAWRSWRVRFGFNQSKGGSRVGCLYHHHTWGWVREVDQNAPLDTYTPYPVVSKTGSNLRANSSLFAKPDMLLCLTNVEQNQNPKAHSVWCRGMPADIHSGRDNIASPAVASTESMDGGGSIIFYYYQSLRANKEAHVWCLLILHIDWSGWRVFGAVIWWCCAGPSLALALALLHSGVQRKTQIASGNARVTTEVILHIKINSVGEGWISTQPNACP